MKRLEEAAIVLGLPSTPRKAGAKHRNRVRPIVLFHFHFVDIAPASDLVVRSYESAPDSAAESQKHHLSKIRPHGVVKLLAFTSV